MELHNVILPDKESPLTKTESDKPPENLANDWNYFLQHHEDKNFEIKRYFDQVIWSVGSVHKLRVSNIYNPSYFWVVIKEGELNIFHKYLHTFYSNHKSHYKIGAKYVKLKLYCVCNIENAYYRAIIVNVPLQVNCKTWVWAFLIDFGFVAKIPIDEIYFMSEKMYDVPQFALRACLAGLGPVSSTTWSSEAADHFKRVAENQVAYAQIINVNPEEKCLLLQLRDLKTCELLSDSLVTDHMAKQMNVAELREMKQAEKSKRTRYGRKAKLPFLSNSFDELELGFVSDLYHVNQLLMEFKNNDSGVKSASRDN